MSSWNQKWMKFDSSSFWRSQIFATDLILFATRYYSCHQNPLSLPQSSADNRDPSLSTLKEATRFRVQTRFRSPSPWPIISYLVTPQSYLVIIVYNLQTHPSGFCCGQQPHSSEHHEGLFKAPLPPWLLLLGSPMLMDPHPCQQHVIFNM